MVTVEILFPKNWRQRNRYRLLEQLCLLGFVVPKGFETDGATVPRLFWPIFPPVGQYFPAAVLHDYLLLERERLKLSRRQADDRFAKALKVLGVSPWRRRLMCGAVRLWTWWISVR